MRLRGERVRRGRHALDRDAPRRGAPPAGTGHARAGGRRRGGRARERARLPRGDRARRGPLDLVRGRAPASPPGATRVEPADEFSSAISTDVWGFAFDDAKRLWVASRRAEGGLAVRLPDGTWRVFDRLPDGTKIGLAYAVARRRAGGVWASLGKRIAACDGETIAPLPDPPAAMSNPYVNKLFEDGKGRLWAASGSGVARLEANGRWSLLTEELGSPYVYFLGEDRGGTVWVGTTRGVYRFGAGDAVEPFTPDDGLAGWETNINGFLSDRDGVVWIGTVEGLSRYDPAAHRRNAHPPRVVVESAELPGGRSPSLRSSSSRGPSDLSRFAWRSSRSAPAGGRRTAPGSRGWRTTGSRCAASPSCVTRTCRPATCASSSRGSTSRASGARSPRSRSAFARRSG